MSSRANVLEAPKVLEAEELEPFDQRLEHAEDLNSPTADFERFARKRFHHRFSTQNGHLNLVRQGGPRGELLPTISPGFRLSRQPAPPPRVLAPP